MKKVIFTLVSLGLIATAYWIGSRDQAESKSFTSQTLQNYVKLACQMQSYTTVLNAHTISADEYEYYADAFWPTNKYPVKPFSYKDIENIVNHPTSLCSSYLCFDPTSQQDAADIKHTIIPNANYSSLTSCYSVSLFKGILENKKDQGAIFYFTKGKKILIDESTSKRVIKTIVLFSVVYTDGSILYYDIADDPTHRVAKKKTTKPAFSFVVTSRN